MWCRWIIATTTSRSSAWCTKPRSVVFEKARLAKTGFFHAFNVLSDDAWQADAENHAAFQGICRVDSTTVCLHDGLRKRQPKTRTRRLTRPCPRAPVETFEDVWQFGRRNPWTMVADLQDGVAMLG